MELLYFTLLPLINALNFSQTLIIPLLVSVLAVGWAALAGRMQTIPLLWLDRLLLLLLGVALLGTAVNLLRLDARNLNHLVALVASLLFFYLGVERFSRHLSDAQILRAVWWGYAACTAFSLLEFALTNFKGINIGNMIPRPAVEDYEPTFLDLLLIRARSTFEESGHFAAYMAMCLPFLVHYHWRLRPSLTGKVTFCVLTTGAMLVAFSVSAFLFLPVAALVVSAIYSLRTMTISRSTAVLLGLLMLSVLALAVSEDLLYNVFLRKFQGASFADRSEKFVATMDLMADASWLHVFFGFGPGSYANLGIKPAISVYFNALRDYGVLGMGMWLLVVSYAIASAARLDGPMGRAVLFGTVLVAMYFLAIPNYFHPHYYLPLLFYKRAFTAAESTRGAA